MTRSINLLRRLRRLLNKAMGLPVCSNRLIVQAVSDLQQISVRRDLKFATQTTRANPTIKTRTQKNPANGRAFEIMDRPEGLLQIGTRGHLDTAIRYEQRCFSMIQPFGHVRHDHRI